MQRHNENGMKIASWLSAHPKVEQVFILDCRRTCIYDIAKKQMHGFGGMMSFSLKGISRRDYRSGKHEVAHKAASLGSVGTLVGPPQYNQSRGINGRGTG